MTNIVLIICAAIGFVIGKVIGVFIESYIFGATDHDFSFLVAFLGAFIGCVYALGELIPSLEKAAGERELAARKKQNQKESAERQKQEQEKLAEREKQQQKELAERIKQTQEKNKKQALSNISRLVSDAQVSAATLPLFLSKVELSLDQAESEFSEGLYSPFWEAMEKAVENMSWFNSTLRAIGAARERHSIEAPPLKPDAVAFSLGMTVLPETSATTRRMKALYRQAQKDPHFAQIYEQRRTNAILIEGFRSLGDALSFLGDRIESDLRSLSSQLDFRLSDLESALRDSSNQMEIQHNALLKTAQSWREEACNGNAELVAVARSSAEQAERDAKERRKYETETRTMLDNIQRRKKPFL